MTVGAGLCNDDEDGVVQFANGGDKHDCAELHELIKGLRWGGLITEGGL